MAVTKRTRYEVLKRDNHTCRYCGATAPDVKLHVDHVIPVALGGTDKPDNLVAACEDCNSGKTSTTPNDALVAEVNDKALAWTAALKRAMDEMAVEASDRQKVIKWFIGEWANRYDEHMGDLPNDWRTTVAEFSKMGVPIALIDEAIDITCEKGLPDHKNFRYFAGICWNHVRTIQERAQTSLEIPDGTKRCGHCSYCIRNKDHPDELEWFEVDYCLTHSPLDVDEERVVCRVCGSPTCMYEHGWIEGEEEGSVDTYMRFRRMIDHYKTCPEVDHG